MDSNYSKIDLLKSNFFIYLSESLDKTERTQYITYYYLTIFENHIEGLYR